MHGRSRLRGERLRALPHVCRTNRFYAMIRVCRKVCLAQLLDAGERELVYNGSLCSAHGAHSADPLAL